MAKGKYDYKYSMICTKEELDELVERKRSEPGVIDVKAMQINAISYLVVWKKAEDKDDAQKGR